MPALPGGGRVQVGVAVKNFRARSGPLRRSGFFLSAERFAAGLQVLLGKRGRKKFKRSRIPQVFLKRLRLLLSLVETEKGLSHPRSFSLPAFVGAPACRLS